ncbi:SIR2 family protein [Enterobacter quasiroggenkampii]|uniref:SIR2 family protein n=1 Tax=Enterobacter quasiroggenkampii TaxID=2497436 RepID=UPI0021CFBDF2|nr:SIR2 family protein [Enterobacter quasiroggenkampii]MCU6306608.1 SIR2 family protein [Enterobacter quasiroggenkampii]MCU6398743.1 SIR2 family protein [Enterobacter quasiroggenkampii]
MEFSKEIEVFINDFVKDMDEDSVAIFAGAGMSKSQGYVDWKELLSDIAEELGLDINKETDLISLAQFHVNEKGSHSKLTKKIIEEFSDQAEPSETHNILSRLPIKTFWTTNYDTLIEESLKNSYKISDVKRDIDDLSNTKPKRDAIVYKMHGDVTSANKAILYKQQYEQYYKTHAAFITALSGDLVSKTFLFIGFSFTDPNLDYVLSRLYTHDSGKRTHYCFMKDETLIDCDDKEIQTYNIRKQKLRIDDLKRFGIQTLLIKDYSDIPHILEKIEKNFKKKTIFISGSAEEYGSFERQKALDFIHSLSAELIKKRFRIINGFGWGIGSSVINGALDAIYSKPEKYSEEQLVIRPFPQSSSKDKNLSELWEEYRQRMISLAGIAIFMFGNKKDSDGNIIDANGVMREFDIAIERGLIPIPIPTTGYTSKKIYDIIIANQDKYYPEKDWLLQIIMSMNDEDISPKKIVEKVIEIIIKLNK